MKITYKTSKGFTLVELLIVIAIIATLAAISTPVLLGVKQKALTVTATNVCSGFESAVLNFENEYNYLPYGGASAPSMENELRSDDGVVAVLAGLETTLNFKAIKFFTLNKPKGGAGNFRNGLDIDEAAGTAALYDPWGELYFMFFDYDFDGEIEDPFDPNSVIPKKVIIYSLGNDKQSGTLKLNRDNATNF